MPLSRPDMTPEMTVLAEAICVRIRQKSNATVGAKPRKLAELTAYVDGLYDALGMLFACGLQKYPYVHCALTTANSTDIAEAMRFYRRWSMSPKQFDSVVNPTT